MHEPAAIVAAIADAMITSRSAKPWTFPADWWLAIAIDVRSIATRYPKEVTAKSGRIRLILRRVRCRTRGRLAEYATGASEKRSRRCAAESAEPTGRDAALARFFFDVDDVLLGLLDFAGHPLELGECFLAIVGNLRALIRVVAIDDIGGERVNAALERFSEGLGAPLRFARLRHTVAPVVFVFLIGRFRLFRRLLFWHGGRRRRSHR